MLKVIVNWVKNRPGLRQKLRNLRMFYVRKRIGLSGVHPTFNIGMPCKNISCDIQAGAYGSIGYGANICPNVVLGNYVLIAPEVYILGGDHRYDIPGLPIIFSGRPTLPKTLVGDDVWIGSRVTIMAGVKVGRGAIVAAASVVTKDVPEYTVVAGVPAKVVKSRFSDTSAIKKHEKMLSKEPSMSGRNYVFKEKNVSK